MTGSLLERGAGVRKKPAFLRNPRTHQALPQVQAHRRGVARMANDLSRLVYRSDSLIDHGDAPALDAIFRRSVRNNRRDGITGALALPDGTFVQVIEGSSADIEGLMVRLRADSRHKDIVVLGEWRVTARLFEGWFMARPDATPLTDQAFRIVTETGTGAQVTGILLGMIRGPAASWF
jgi:hypothetical protein